MNKLDVTEMVKVEKAECKQDKIVVLVSRTGIDGSSLTREAFIKLMRTDVEQANCIYDDLENLELKEDIRKYEDKRVAEARAYAEKHWPNDSDMQDQWMTLVENAIAEEIGKCYNPHTGGTFYDFQPDMGENGLPGVCVFDGETKAIQYGAAFDILSRQWWWKHLRGWKLCYETHQDCWHCYCRPYVVPILPKKIEKARIQEKKKLEDDICNFYKGTTYFGD